MARSMRKIAMLILSFAILIATSVGSEGSDGVPAGVVLIQCVVDGDGIDVSSRSPSGALLSECDATADCAGCITALLDGGCEFPEDIRNPILIRDGAAIKIQMFTLECEPEDED